MRVAVLLALLVLLPAGLAHGPGVGVTQARPVTSAEGVFLEMSVTAPATGERHDLIAVSTGDGAAAFERKRAGAYRPVGVIPVRAGSQRFGSETTYRIRLPRRPRDATGALLTVMFSGGELVHTEMGVAPPGADGSFTVRIWAPILLLLAGIGVGLPALARRRSAAA